jgi:hypothetical protein
VGAVSGVMSTAPHELVLATKFRQSRREGGSAWGSDLEKRLHSLLSGGN